MHVPSGAVKKDGPSAGVAIAVALTSLLSGGRCATTSPSPARSPCAAVLPVGGIKAKVLAAHRAGIKRVVLPERNRKDVVNIPAVIRAELELHLVSTVEEALEHVLVPAPLAALAVELPAALTQAPALALAPGGHPALA